MSEPTQTTKALFDAKAYKAMAPKGADPSVYIQLVKERIVGNKLTAEDFNLFLYVCHRTGLDPLTNQIYAVARWSSSLGKNTMSIQTGIDGLRLVAQKTGQYLGQDDIEFEPKDESTTYPKKATCTVHKVVGKNTAQVVASARWEEYAQKDRDGKVTGMWAKMPYTMLGKCAEALALRKAFPNDLSGIYSSEEMNQAGNPISELPTPEKFKKEDIEVEHGRPDDLKEVTKAETPKTASSLRTKLSEGKEPESDSGDNNKN